MSEGNLPTTTPPLAVMPVKDPTPTTDEPASPSTPTRAFCAFNDSVDNVNLEDLRDMLPEDTWRDVSPTTASHSTCAHVLDVIVEEAAGCSSHAARVCEDLGDSQDVTAQDRNVQEQDHDLGKLELEMEPDASCSAISCAEGNHTELTFEGQQDSGVVDAARYRYGPAIPSKKTGAKAIYSCCTSGDTSYAEVAEAIVLAVATLLKDWTSSPKPLQRLEDSDIDLADACPHSSASHLPGKRVRGALGYVFHTALSIVYAVAVKYPLQVATSVGSVMLSVIAAILGVLLQVTWWVLGLYWWALLLPLRLVERAITLVWQRVLGRAVLFLNQQPNHSTAFASPGSGPHKHTIPTAINGHAHKH